MTQRPKRVHTFRQSWLGTFWECPEQARLVMTDQYPPDQTEAAAKGTAVHAAIEGVLMDCLEPGVALQRGLDTFRSLASEPGFRWVQVKREATALTHIENGFRSWCRYVQPTLGATAWCEEHFKFLFHEDDEREIWLSGTADYAEVPSGLKDWKLTSNQDKYGKDGWKLSRYGVQPSVYAAAAYELGLFARNEVVPFQFVALNPQGRKPQILEAPRTMDDVHWLRQQCISVAEFIEADLPRWPLRDQSALCSEKWCTAYAGCKGRFADPAKFGVTTVTTSDRPSHDQL